MTAQSSSSRFDLATAVPCFSFAVFCLQSSAAQAAEEFAASGNLKLTFARAALGVFFGALGLSSIRNGIETADRNQAANEQNILGPDL